MEFSPNDFVTHEAILSEVLLYTQEERSENVTKGFLISQIRKCLRALSYDTFFFEQYKDFEIPANGIITLPAGVFNISEMYLFNGTKCEIGNNTKNVYFKNNFFSLGSGSVSRNKFSNGNDPFYSNTSSVVDQRIATNSNGSQASSTPSNLYYYGESNGNIMLSSNCQSYDRVMIKFNGIWTQENKPLIPTFLEEVTVDWVTEAGLRAKAAIDPARWRILWMDSVQRLGYKPESFNGSWYKAETRIKRMGSKSREDMMEYLGRLNY
jgi:hypothetical protein